MLVRFALLLAVTASLIASAACAQGRNQDPCETASTLMKMKNYKSALKHLDVCLKQRPRNARALVDRGSAYLQINEPDRALADFNKAIKLKPDMARAYMQRAFVYVELGRMSDAIADLDTSIELKPHFHAFSLRGRLLCQSGKFKEGLPDLTQAIKMHASSGTYYDRGSEYLRVKQYEKAIADFSEAIKIAPTSEFESAIVKHSYANRAEAYEKLGKKELAKKDRAMIHKEDEHPNLLLELAK